MAVGGDMTYSGRRAVQAEARRVQLVDTALALFAAEGAEEATIKRLAQAAGVAPGLIYHYFPDKEALLIAVVEHHSFLPHLHMLLAAADDHPPEVVLRRLSTDFLAMLATHTPIVRIFIREAQTHPHVAAAWNTLVTEGTALLTAYLDDQIAAGALRPHDTLVTARTFFFTHLMLHLTGTASDAFAVPFVETLLHGIAPTAQTP